MESAHKGFKMVILPFVALALAPIQSLHPEVVSVKETRIWAGRMGNLVTRTVTYKVDGRLVTVTMSSYHDRFRPIPKNAAIRSESRK